jgi:cation transport ATPase
MLDLAKAGSFFFCILVLCRAAMHAFFDPAASLQDRILLALAQLFFAACVAVFSGFIFTWPVRSNPEYGRRITSTLPIRVFLWASAGMVTLFLTSWYLGDLARQAAPFISSRTLNGF